VNETVPLVKGHLVGLIFFALNSRIGSLSDEAIFTVDGERVAK